MTTTLETPVAGDDTPAAPRTAVERLRRWLWPVILPVILVLVAGALRLWHLDDPERCYFDETYYYYDAREYLERGTESSFAVHPPVGKWIIATGLALFGVDEGSPLDEAVTEEPTGCIKKDGEAPNPAARAREAADAFARRVMSAIFGTAAVFVTYLLGLQLFRRRSAALLGGALVAVDGLALTMSRIAMLDIFLQFFVVLGVMALVIDARRLFEGVPRNTLEREQLLEAAGADMSAAPHTWLPVTSRKWLWLGGLFLGLAFATKWSAIAAMFLAGVWVLAGELFWRKRWTGRATTDLLRGLARVFLALVAVPILVYVISYAGWFANFENTRKHARCDTAAQTLASEQAAAAEVGDGATVAPPEVPGSTPVLDGDGCGFFESIVQISGGWWEEQGEIFRFHKNLDASHPYRAPATTWALMTRPVAYYYESCSATQDNPYDPCEVRQGNVAEVLGMGNPAIWWLALVGYPVLLWLAVARGRWGALTIALFLFGQALPYLLAPRPVFLFYMTPVVPFIALSLAYLSDEALEHPSYRWFPAAVVVIVLTAFVFWAPLFLGIEISRPTWDTLIWFRSWI